MSFKKSIQTGASVVLLNAACLAGMWASPALAQQASTPATDAATGDDVIVVTGFRESLRNATQAKRDATNFGESVFAEDLGKFPDLNLAESLQRVPGLVVQRDAFSGDGTQVSVRALPSSFTQVTMNGNRVAVASDFGFTGSSSPNRQVDLDMFPTGLFNRVDVQKTPTADLLEGGIAGTVNVQNARAFDRPGRHIVLDVKDAYSQNAEAYSPRTTAIYSDTIGDTFGFLVGYSGADKKIFSDGWETVGWGDPNLSNFCASCDPGLTSNQGVITNPQGSNQFRWSNTVYSYTGNGLTPGALTESQLLALNPGLTEDTMKGALLPRLGRPYLLDADTSNDVGLVSLELRPASYFRVTFDLLAGKADRDATRTDMMWAVRNTGPGDDYNGGMIPIGMTVDANDVVTGGTFANSTFFSETNFYRDRTSFVNAQLGATWDITDNLRWTGEYATMHSTYERDVTFLKFRTPFQSTITATYANNGDDMPTITSNVNLNDPNIGWRFFNGGGQTTLQRDKRDVITESGHTDLTWDMSDAWSFRAGYAHDEFRRRINIRDNSAALAAAFASAIPNSALGQYLSPMSRDLFQNGVSGAGFNRFIVPNFDKIAAAINYDALFNAPGNVTLSTTYNGAGASNISESTDGAYFMVTNNMDMFGVPVRTNLGLRYQKTDQVNVSPSIINNQVISIETDKSYDDYLPSLNVVASPTDNIRLRLAASKTMTRANPSQLSSTLGFSDPSAQSASRGNPALQPFYSDNIDIGGEYYTSETGYVGFTWFQKKIQNYTTNTTLVTPFPQLGVDFANLSGTQQNAIAVGLGTTVGNIQSNPSLLANWNVNVSTTINSTAELNLTGEEFIWVQPLDNFVDGLGFSVNYTHFDYDNQSLGTGIPDYTYNLTGYYEHGGFSTHISYVYTGQSTIGIRPSANSIPYNWFGQERHQIDLSASYKFDLWGLHHSVTFDGLNLDDQGFRTYLGYENVPYGFNNPGRTLLFGYRIEY